MSMSCRQNQTCFLALTLTTIAFFAPLHANAKEDILVSTSSRSVYATGGTVAITDAVSGDLSVFGGILNVSAPVSGDALLSGLSITLQAPVSGDARMAGGSIAVEGSVTGDLLALGNSVTVSGAAPAYALIAARNVTLAGGAAGSVSVYGNNVVLGGTFASDVHIVALGRIALLEGTIIQGGLTYESPQKAHIPESASVLGEIKGASPSYLPSAEEVRNLLLAGVLVFLLVRFLAGMILAGLAAGLLPELTRSIVAGTFGASTTNRLMTLALGVGVFVAGPMLIVLLLLTFVGIGVALLMLALYFLLALGAYAYAGVLTGVFIARRVWRREAVYWYDGALGMLALLLAALVPFIGPILFMAVVAFAGGMLARLLFRMIFPSHSKEHLLS